MSESNINSDVPSILNKIVKQKRIRLDEMDVVALNERLQPSKRSLVDALASKGSSFIFECKKRSPSRGLLSEDYHPAEIAKVYQPFASAISVLTEADFFGGQLADLTEVSCCIEQPVLCKDFVIETSQLLTARAAGADIVLLMLSVISDEFWLECYEVATQLHLDIITEVSNLKELQRAINLPAKIIGINNRDLHTLKTNIATTEELAPLIPKDRLIISESGLSSHQQIIRLAPLVDGFLIGSSMMQSNNMDRAIRKLIFGEVKVCGLTNRKDADVAWQNGASYGGMIFTEKSSRFINIDQGKTICESQAMPMVGVFLNQPIEHLIEHAETLGLHAVQLHGDEGIEYADELREKLKKNNIDCQIWKAISCSDVMDEYPSSNEAKHIAQQWFEHGTEKVLIDTPKGQTQVVDHRIQYSLFIDDEHILIAGGLSVEAPKKIASSKAGFDLCSSLEKSSGIKNHTVIEQLFKSLTGQKEHHESA